MIVGNRYKCTLLTFRLKTSFNPSRTMSIPIIDHPHNDKENNQQYHHYHVDFRFISKKHHNSTATRVNLNEVEVISINHKLRTLYTTNQRNITSPEYISKSNLKHKCIHKGKCPHRGFDLSSIEPDSHGIIKCPLHGLMFNSTTKALITDNQDIVTLTNPTHQP